MQSAVQCSAVQLWQSSAVQWHAHPARRAQLVGGEAVEALGLDEAVVLNLLCCDGLTAVI